MHQKLKVKTMPALLYLVVITSLLANALFADEIDDADRTQYELQTLIAKPGKLDALHGWFRAHQDDVLAKHGATNIAYLVPAGENPARKLVCLFKYPSTRAIMKFSRAVKADPLWKPLDTTHDGPELLIEKMDITTLQETDFSPKFTPEKAIQQRVFELRTYTCPSPEKLFYLNSRFRDHTMGLFKKHGMENLVYWHPLDIEDSERKLVYLLSHKSVEAAKGSFAAFRKDPEWLTAKARSEEQAGGSLTEKENGVVSELFVATEYSPLK
jgi:hypothetical protein